MTDDTSKKEMSQQSKLGLGSAIPPFTRGQQRYALKPLSEEARERDALKRERDALNRQLKSECDAEMSRIERNLDTLTKSELATIAQALAPLVQTEMGELRAPSKAKEDEQLANELREGFSTVRTRNFQKAPAGMIVPPPDNTPAPPPSSGTLIQK